MKSYVFSILLVLAPVLSFADDPPVQPGVTFLWDARPPEEPVAGYTIWIKQADGSWKKLITVQGQNTTQANVTTLPGGTHEVCITAFNAAGLHGAPSDPITFPVPGKVEGAKLAAQVQTSVDLRKWKTIATVPLPEDSEKLFVRTIFSSMVFKP